MDKPRPTKKQNLLSLSLWLVFDSGSCVRVPVSKWISLVHTCAFGYPSPCSRFRIRHCGQIHIRGGKNGISSNVRHEPSLFLQQHKRFDSPKSTNNVLRGVIPYVCFSPRHGHCVCLETFHSFVVAVLLVVSRVLHAPASHQVSCRLSSIARRIISSSSSSSSLG